ncbi:SGNH/GDSL hydrolase family protein [Alkalicoccobacillus gibsonii]|uniref:SGNH/GDSL hydrolase family protein n=1 Tax=Alkalicoccobacillus gibsonii TaxID=79881 RepID=UPI001931DD9D|nr:SGNH/GDSL hydrolase family protein [Alkalicoccobacillus gibsonii]MBM0066062.1 SGNH/GDSL hydrolase family protein [Alkalicoccobacillus gibsonii]
MFILKNLAFVLTIILSIGIIAFGYISYQNKLNDLATNAETDVTNNTTNSSNEIIETEESHSFGGILGDTYENLESNELNIVFFGSSALESVQDESTEVDIWPDLLVQAIESDSHPVRHEIINVESQSTLDILNSSDIDLLMRSNPDIVFLESLTLNDNGLLLIEESEDNLNLLLTQLNEELPNSKIILYPSNPLLNPVQYLTQIQSLNQFAEENSILYANHWGTFPEVTDPQIEEYSKSGILSEKGHQELAEFMEEFLTK